MELLAVYGTLKKGHPNHQVIDDAEYLGQEAIKGWAMYSLGYFPCIVPMKLSGQVVVEVYKVPDLARADRLEGYPNFYDRVQVPTSHGDAWVYFMRKVPTGAKRIKSGVWQE
jgi:gamma-glutamylcyclotransferase (GGCT)/AIG2-like uncharacterized protein YtfP